MESPARLNRQERRGCPALIVQNVGRESAARRGLPSKPSKTSPAFFLSLNVSFCVSPTTQSLHHQDSTTTQFLDSPTSSEKCVVVSWRKSKWPADCSLEEKARELKSTRLSSAKGRMGRQRSCKGGSLGPRPHRGGRGSERG